jgi:hypothetical protein
MLDEQYLVEHCTMSLGLEARASCPVLFATLQNRCQGRQPTVASCADKAKTGLENRADFEGRSLICPDPWAVIIR